MISTKIIIDYSIVEPYSIIIMLSEPNIICINNLLNWEKDISISVWTDAMPMYSYTLDGSVEIIDFSPDHSFVME